jgi:hypothetical protein
LASFRFWRENGLKICFGFGFGEAKGLSLFLKSAIKARKKSFKKFLTAVRNPYGDFFFF